MFPRLKTAAIAGFALIANAALLSQANAQAGIFEVFHPDVEKGQVALEVLNGFDVDNVPIGDERSVHEFAVGYSFTDFWKLTVAFEVPNPRNEAFELEALELENLLLLPFFGEEKHHDHEEQGSSDDDDHGHGPFVLGLFTGLELPREGGISEGAVEIGPVWEVDLEFAEWVGNLFAEIPLNDEDAGLAYANQVVFPVTDAVGLGFETYGEFEGLFGDGDEQQHVIGPAIYYEYETPNGSKIEPRLAALFGLNDNSPDAVISFNVEFKFGGDK